MMAKLLCLAFLFGCESATALDEPSGARAVRLTDDLMVRFHMYRSYDYLRAIERLLIRGNLEDARALAGALAAVSAPPALDAWTRQTGLVQDRALWLATATGIDEACRRLARLSEACASCHVDAGAVPRFDTPPKVPADRQTIDSRMARHRWAADRVWEGMIGHADAPWRAGLDVLAATPPPFSPLDSDRVAMAKRLQELAMQASQRRMGDTLAERAQTYGELLVTCAACHSGLPVTLRDRSPAR
jgi:cytochrome c553